MCVCVCVCVYNFLGRFSWKRVCFQLGLHLRWGHGHAADKLCLDYSRRLTGKGDEKETVKTLWGRRFKLPLNSNSFFFFFNWRITAWQYGDSFCCPTTWISHMYTYVTFFLSLPPPSQPWRSPQSINLSSLCYKAASHSLSVLHTVVYICQSYSLHSSQPLFAQLCLHKPVLHICTSISSLQIGSSVPVFLDATCRC